MSFTNEELRNIDALIAEKVMGWKLWNYEHDRYAESPDDYDNASNNDGWTWEGAENPEEAWEWRPTTDPVCSKQLREKLAETWAVTTLRHDKEPYEESPFEFCVATEDFDGNDRGDMKRGCADTEELAVALCALKAYGIEAALEGR